MVGNIRAIVQYFWGELIYWLYFDKYPYMADYCWRYTSMYEYFITIDN